MFGGRSTHRALADAQVYTDEQMDKFDAYRKDVLDIAKRFEIRSIHDEKQE